MKSGSVLSLLALVVAALVVAGCAQGAPSPAPAPTSAPAAPAKAAEPAKAPAPTTAPQPTAASEPAKAAVVQPTAAPAPVKKVEWPEKGKAITMIVPMAAGGSLTVAAQLMAPMLEKELGVPVQVVNKGAAGGQVGITELAMAKPDGYTLGYFGILSGIVPYIDPDKKAAYGRKDLLPVSMLILVPESQVVAAKSPIKTVDDLVKAAKAKPGQVTIGTTGALGINHLAILMLQKAAGVKFRSVHFDGGGPQQTALLGGHIDVAEMSASGMVPQLRSGEVRYLSIMAKEQNKLYPGVPTMDSQGYKLYLSSPRGIVAPAGLPKDVLDVLSAAIKKVAQTDKFISDTENSGAPMMYLDSPQFSTYWDEVEAQVRPLYDEAKLELAGKS